jgi:FixJ family two-component response regulator
MAAGGKRVNSKESGTTILLVEDDVDFSNSLIPRLEKRGCHVKWCPSAEDALGLLQRSEFDVAVVDLKLPEMHGTEFIRRVRTFDEALPVIVLTGYASLETAADAVRLSVTDYLLKPLDSVEDLLDPIRKAVHNRALAEENRRLVLDLRRRVQELEKARSESRDKEKRLAEKNTALRELIDQVREESERVYGEIRRRIERFVHPTLKRLRRGKGGTDRDLVNLLKKKLENITNPPSSGFPEETYDLTPREAEICGMIRENLTSKQIGALLGVSAQTVEKHRARIRAKCGIANKKTSLRAFLNNGHAKKS